MQNDPRLKRLSALARRYAQQGRDAAAEKTCHQCLAIDPDDRSTLALLAELATRAGRHLDAADCWDRCAVIDPEDLEARRRQALALAEAGRLADAAQVRIALLERQPEHTDDWAALARIYRDLGNDQAATQCFTRAFQLDGDLASARRNPAAPIERRRLSQEGDDLLHGYHFASNDELTRALAAERGEVLPERWHRFLRRFHRREPNRYADGRQQPDYHYYEGLRAQPFWPRADFPWLDEVEAATDVIRDEFLAANAGDAEFKPYVQASEQAPPAWKQLSNQLTWASLHLIKGNRRVEENSSRCPRTTALMERLPLARADDHAPEVFFSVLRPGTHIPPHYGVSNTKLAIHLPLIIPADCAIRVGGETQGWEPGRCLVFDDSFLHEAWNRSEELRVVLIFETWNPDLTPLEIECIRAIIARGEAWNQATRDLEPTELPAA